MVKIVVATLMAVSVSFGGSADSYLKKFAYNLNSQLRSMSSNLRITKKELAPPKGKGSKTVTYWIGKNIFILTTADKKGIESFLMLGRGDGTPNSGVNIILSGTAAVLALFKPTSTKNERGGIATSIVNDKVLQGGKVTYNYGGYVFTASYDKILVGYSLTADRSKK